MHHHKSQQVLGRDVWIETWAQAVDIGFWMFTRTTIGTQVNIWKTPPPPREEPSAEQKLVCRIFWFICAPLAWIANQIQEKNRWSVDADPEIEIIIRNTYYDAAARIVDSDEKRCISESKCELALERVSVGLSGYPDLNGTLVYGVCTSATIRIFGEEFEHNVWESDGHDLPCQDSP